MLTKKRYEFILILCIHVFLSNILLYFTFKVFDHIGMPLLRGLVQGKDGLLFTYGVTGSGKTYTMTGERNNAGITPRCIDTLFNTIGDCQIPKFTVKSDKMNGFEIQSDVDALGDRMQEVKQKRRVVKK